MKASESIPNFTPKLREYTNFATRSIKKICTEIGPRPCGSEEELKSQQFMAAQVGNAADEVHTEEFSVHPGAFFGWMKIDAVLLLCGIALFVAGTLTGFAIMQYISLALAVIAAIFMFGEFLFYKEFIDFMFKKETSHNTYCVRKPVGEVKRRIIIGGHSDSSFEWRFTHLGGAPALYVTLISAAVGLVYMVVIGILAIVLGEDMSPVFAYVSIAFVPSFICLFVFLNTKVCVQGANDNLTGCMCAAAVMKYMGDNNLRFENTELVVLFSGGEEAGLRGAKAFAKAHMDELKEVETMFFAMDTFRDDDSMDIYSRDMSGLTKHDSRCCNLVKKAGEYAGRELKFSSIFCGASDAAAVTQAGIPAVALAAMYPGPPKYYHTREDTWDNMNPRCVEKGIQIALETAYLFDEKGLCENYD
ncbi:MAG: M20/M25/M40 family metallo-hydrolase [Clostridia bacterium]|nr:M20/M25/M40 family metallo-hydrolase [Clostridia bacterium]